MHGCPKSKSSMVFTTRIIVCFVSLHGEIAFSGNLIPDVKTKVGLGTRELTINLLVLFFETKGQ